jgi:hypothetical protein
MNMRGSAGLRVFLWAGLCAGLFAVACGRSELDLAPADELPVTTGAAGSATTTGAAGSATTTGAAGTTTTTGTAGTVGTAGTTGTAGFTTTTGTAGTTGAAGTTGVAGAVGTGGTGPLPPNEISCGAATCFAGMQACCVRPVNGRPTPMCIPADETCDMGVSIGCVSTAACGPGAVCCVSATTLSTTCEEPAACLLSPGIILCSADADCPGLLPNCCGIGALGVCRARACGGNGGGAGGPPPGPPAGGPPGR